MIKQDRPSGDRGAAYLRTSDPKSDIASQRPIIRDWLAAHGLTATYWLEDEGWARSTADVRPDFQRLNALVDAGELDWVCVSEQDRASWEDPWAFAAWLHRLRTNGVELWSTSQGLLTSLDVGQLILTIFGAAKSREEVAGLGDRVVRGKSDKARTGRWMGGSMPPYAFDVMMLDPNGVPYARLIYEAKDRRKVVYADGREERCDGKENRLQPPTKSYTFRLVPTQDQTKIDVCRKVWGWLASEEITVNAVADRLNKLQIPSNTGKGWYGVLLSKMMRNPVYRGAVAYNKRGHGKYKELIGGQRRDVPLTKGKAKKGRNRDESDWIVCENAHEQIIDDVTFAKVLAKLNNAKRPTRSAPRSEKLWLGSLLVCSQCNKRMAGWTAKNDKWTPHSYVCSNYRRLSHANPTGCRLHRVSHPVIEDILTRWLDTAGVQLEAIEQSDYNVALLKELGKQKWDAGRRLLQCQESMREWVEAHLGGPTTIELDGHSYETVDVRKVYTENNPTSQAQTHTRIAELTEELRGLVRNHSRLSGRAQALAEEEIRETDAQIAALETTLTSWDDREDKTKKELAAVCERIREARDAMNGSESRRKAESIGRLVGRVLCRFEHYREAGQDRSRLVEVTVEPLEGDATVAFRDEDVSSCGVVAKILARTFCGEELAAVA